MYLIAFLICSETGLTRAEGRIDNFRTNRPLVYLYDSDLHVDMRKRKKKSHGHVAYFVALFTALGRGSTNFLPRQLNEFDLEQYFVDVSIPSPPPSLVSYDTPRLPRRTVL